VIKIGNVDELKATKKPQQHKQEIRFRNTNEDEKLLSVIDVSSITRVTLQDTHYQLVSCKDQQMKLVQC